MNLRVCVFTGYRQQRGQRVEYEKRRWCVHRVVQRCRHSGNSGGAGNVLDPVEDFDQRKGRLRAQFFALRQFSHFYTILLYYYDAQVSFKNEFKDELKFIAKCRGSTKPARKKQPSSSAENSNPTGSKQYMGPGRQYGDFDQNGYDVDTVRRRGVAT